MAQQSQHFEDEGAYYYDFHPTEEDLMGETSVHADLVHYLREVLNWRKPAAASSPLPTTSK
ncbi:MAG TPA: hypothetical protein VFN02_07180 [Ktedonobacteraceae bacterium]|nr:hypothetical protein [Ktedonobacteraceae bacterium]